MWPVRCRLQVGEAVFEGVGAGEDPKGAYSDAIKRAAVRAGIGESLYAMDSPWLRVGNADAQLRVNRAGKPYLDERTTRWPARMHEAWLTRAGSIFGEPLPHAPLARALDARDERFARAYASSNTATIIDGSCAGWPRPSFR